MRQADVKIGSFYEAKVSDKLTVVKVTMAGSSGFLHRTRRWHAINVATGREVRVTAAKLRREITDANEYADLLLGRNR